MELKAKTPIGLIDIPSWEAKKVIDLTDEELIERAVAENKLICISPAVFAMIEKRSLWFRVRDAINPNVGFRHDTFGL